MDHLPGWVVHGDPVLLRKITNMFVRHSAERRNAECLRLISFVTLKVGERRPPLSQQHRWSCSQQTSSICLPSFILIFIFSFILPSPPPRPLYSAYPHPPYRLLPDRIRTRHYPTPFTRSDGPLRNGQTSRISLHPHLYLTSWTSSGYLSPGLVSLCLSLL